MYEYDVVLEGIKYDVFCDGVALQEGTGQITFFDKDGIVLAIFPNTTVIRLIGINGILL
jgi:hypothetical protein